MPQQRGATFVLVSHSPTTVLELCARAIWIDNGRVRADGPAADVVAQFTGPPPPVVEADAARRGA